MAGKQWLQQRLFRAKLVKEEGCQLCKANCAGEGGGGGVTHLGVPGGEWYNGGIDVASIGYFSEEDWERRRREGLQQPMRVESTIGTLSGRQCAEVHGGGGGMLTEYEEEVARWQPKAYSEVGCIPCGTLVHRHWFCPEVWRRTLAGLKDRGAPAMEKKLRKLREQAQALWLRHWKHGDAIDRPLWERAMTNSATADIQGPNEEGTFNWVKRGGGREGDEEGDIYSDASMLDGPGELGRVGWGFVVVGPGTDCIVAAANGVPPRWIDSVPKGEAWALLMAARACDFISNVVTLDCLSVLQTLRAGKRKATSPSNLSARLWQLIMPYLEDEVVDERIRWMPAHRKEEEAASLRNSRGREVTVRDIRANEAVDKLAKEAVEEHRVPLLDRMRARTRESMVRLIAYSIGMAAVGANQASNKGGRDSQPCEEGKDRRREGRKERTESRQQRPVQLGGHVLEKEMGGWRCVVCRQSSREWRSIAHKKCAGNAAEKWAVRVRDLVSEGRAEGTFGSGHTRFMSDGTIWCDKCGATATHHAVGLALPCRGRPKPGGVEQNLRMLRRGVNPNTRRRVKDGPYPEPGMVGRAEVGRGEWGTGKERYWLKDKAANLRPKARTEAIAGERLQRIRDRIKARGEARERGRGEEGKRKAAEGEGNPGKTRRKGREERGGEEEEKNEEKIEAPPVEEGKRKAAEGEGNPGKTRRKGGVERRGEEEEENEEQIEVPNTCAGGGAEAESQSVKRRRKGGE